MKYFAAGLVALSLAGSVGAQNTIYWSAPSPAATSGTKYYLPIGTPVPLRTITQISTKDNKPGDRLYLQVAENVMYQNQVVIPVGAPVVAEVSSVQRNGHVGKKGKIQVRLIEVQTPNGPVPLIGDASREGRSGTLLSVGTMLFVSTLGGFLIHGTSATIPPGTPVQAQLAGELAFRARPGEQSADSARVVPSSFNF